MIWRWVKPLVYLQKFIGEWMVIPPTMVIAPAAGTRTFLAALLPLPRAASLPPPPPRRGT